MKSLLLILALAATNVIAAATAPEIQIQARYTGFGPALLGDMDPSLKNAAPDQQLSAPSVTINLGETAVIQVSQETKVPGESKPVDTGAILQVTFTAHGNKTTLTGKSTVRHLLNADPDQPLGAVSFATRETYFSGDIEFGKPFVIHLGDTPADKAQVTLVAKQIIPSPAKPISSGPPALRLLRLNTTFSALEKVMPSSEFQSAKKQLAGTEGPNAVLAVLSQPVTSQFTKTLGNRAQNVPIAKESGITAAAVLLADNFTMDLTFSDGRIKAWATVWPGQSILMAERDQTSSDGIRFFLLSVD